MAEPGTRPPVRSDDPTIGKLVSDTSRHVSSLVQQEIRLAKSELKVSVRNGGLGAGLFAGAVPWPGSSPARCGSSCASRPAAPWSCSPPPRWRCCGRTRRGRRATPTSGTSTW